jgi:hypothetical protein
MKTERQKEVNMKTERTEGSKYEDGKDRRK